MILYMKQADSAAASRKCKTNIALPAQRLHEVSVQEVMISLYGRYVYGELGI